jgi:hypothetical protein
MPVLESQRIRAEDFGAPWYRLRSRQMRLPAGQVHRKYWEWAAIAEVFIQRVGHGRALGFGVGVEPISAWLVAHGADEVVATDLDSERAGKWIDSFIGCQHAAAKHDIPWQSVCSAREFKRVRFEVVDMNAIPRRLRQGEFDFTWSAGSFEHIGGLDAGLDFFCRQMSCLRPGGVAAHTTEYNYGSNDKTLEAEDLALYRQRDLDRLARMLARQGDRLVSLDLRPGDQEADGVVLHHPYEGNPHLAIRLSGGHVTTSVLLVAERSAA